MNQERLLRWQRGVATLVVTALLAFAMLLVAVLAHRNVAVEAGASAAQYRSTQAFEAADAGIGWAIAKLNDNTNIGTDCLPDSDASAVSFRAHHLHGGASPGGWVPTTWDDAGMMRSLQAACWHTDTGWACSCPSSGAPVVPRLGGTVSAAFNVELAAGPRPDLVRIVATACTSGSSVCPASAGSANDASSRIETLLALMPGLRAGPAAALTAGGDVDSSGAPLGIHNEDAASGGVAVHAGGRVIGTGLRPTAPAGSALDNSIASADPDLASADPGTLFARHFGMDKGAWMAQPAVTRIDCAAACAREVAALAARGSQLLAIAGDLSLDGPIALGTAERPVVVMATGTIRINGAVALHGFVYASAIDWRGGAGGASIQGAAVAERDFTGSAEGDLAYDAATLQRLMRGTGNFVPVSGSWKDF